jgi:polyphosphate glucokinase
MSAKPASAAGGPRTLAIDIGGTGLKASVLGSTGALAADRVRVDTTYPCSPQDLVAALAKLVGPLPAYERIAAGFPGMVREGRVLSAPHFVTVAGPGSKVSRRLEAAWSGFDLAGALEAALGKPARVANDADVQGAAVIHGSGLELVVTLGTGVGTALFYQGRLMPHLELAHHPLRKGETYNQYVGDAARRRVGNAKWNRRVQRAVDTLDALLFPDHVYVGGGNAARVRTDLGPKVTTVDNVAGILGGAKLWDCV